jgi:hypothetical protein
MRFKPGTPPGSGLGPTAGLELAERAEAVGAEPIFPLVLKGGVVRPHLGVDT